ncbi:MAG: methyltransferase domain-containing protein [Candidatus Zeuxoniibacter abyssi]|nr:MAG: methyltransferase domain-containing protein [Candidatus Persebacteraceae bacterium AB1(2)]
MAERYDSRWSFYVEMTVRETAARLGLSGAERLLDVGCGTGELLRHLSAAHPAPLLSGIDPVAEMLSVARRKLGTAIDLREGWAENLPFDSQRFDVVVSCNMFHYILHPADSLGEMRRVLRSGGRLVITDWCGDFWTCRVCDWYLRFFRSAHINVYREQALVLLLEDSGYVIANLARYKISRLWGLMTVVATVA